jgi:hypothetical protein
MIVDERACVVLGLCLMAEQTNFWHSCADPEKEDRVAVPLDQLFLVLGDQVVDLVSKLAGESRKKAMSGVGLVGRSVWH